MDEAAIAKELLELKNRVEDLENEKLELANRLIPLTQSHTLEDVKGRVNEIIAILNQLSIN